MNILSIGMKRTAQSSLDLAVIVEIFKGTSLMKIEPFLRDRRKGIVRSKT